MSTIRALLPRITGELRAADIEDAELDARYFLAALIGVEPKALFARLETSLSPVQLTALHGFVARRIAHEPVSRILQQRGFWTLDLKVTPDTLDPRPDTETLIELALELLRGSDIARPRIADLGTGTGAILLALLSEAPDAYGVALDISAKALQIARDNARALALASRCAFVVANWAACLAPVFDLIISNPPYIPSADIPHLDAEVRLHDPLLALDGGADGLDAYRRIIREARSALRPHGWIVLEAGIGQAPDILALLEAAGFEALGARKDLGGIDRAIFGRLRHGKP